MIEAKFTFFQVQQEGMFRHARKLVETTFGKAPERLDAVDVDGALYEFAVAVVNAVVAVEADVYQPIVTVSAIGAGHRGRVNFAPDNTLQGIFRAIGYYFRVHLAHAFEQAKNDSCAARSLAPFAAYLPGAEVRLVEFERATQLNQHWLELVEPALQKQIHSVDGTHAQTPKPRGVGSR